MRLEVTPFDSYDARTLERLGTGLRRLLRRSAVGAYLHGSTGLARLQPHVRAYARANYLGERPGTWDDRSSLVAPVANLLVANVERLAGAS